MARAEQGLRSFYGSSVMSDTSILSLATAQLRGNLLAFVFWSVGWELK
jgi:hypothetical protein